jgi:hypothetical protein
MTTGASLQTIECYFPSPSSHLSEWPNRVRVLLTLPDLPRRDNPGEPVDMWVRTGPGAAAVGRANRAGAASSSVETATLVSGIP